MLTDTTEGAVAAYLRGYAAGAKSATETMVQAFDEVVSRGLCGVGLAPIAPLVDSVVFAPRQAAEFGRLRVQWPRVPRRVHDLAQQTLLNPQTSADSILLLAEAVRELAVEFKGRGVVDAGTDYWRLSHWLFDAAAQRSGWQGGDR